MKSLDTNLKKETIKLAPDGAFLWALEFSPNASQTIYLVSNNESIVFDSKTYEPFPMDFSVIYDEDTGDVSEASLSVSNVKQYLTSHFMDNRGFTNTYCTIRRIHTEWLDDPNVHDSQTFLVKESTLTEEALVFSLGNESYFQIRIPFDKFRRGYCSWRYNFPLENGHQIAITAATNASPIVITTSGHHGLETGQVFYVAGVGGNTAANGTWKGTYVAANRISLDNSSGNGSYTSGGVIKYATGPDCGYTGQTLDITTASSANPIVVTTKEVHAMETGQIVTIAGVSGNSAANGTFQATVTGNKTFTIPAAGVGSGTGGTVTYVLPKCSRLLNDPIGCSAHRNTRRIRLVPGTMRR